MKTRVGAFFVLGCNCKQPVLAERNKMSIPRKEDFSIYTFIKMAQEAKVVRKIGSRAIVNVQKLNEYIEDMYS